MMMIVQKMTIWGKSKDGLMQMSGLYKFTSQAGSGYYAG